ncbi:CRISPR-associated endonuclease Cas1 [Bacillus sp. 165]|uniref:CRISPR-associated endonuclease Cas1 n=1 Tax=Bacillus sp. 165 TaxID=1529117 RepID=UPI001ADB7769|nr:CRISPR-associated endonuclease Cas1 [Bacillus sp. 165]MBO9129097.1 CRISPR-associated endonuclease Cas1 [Bacillus sp. 165]
MSSLYVTEQGAMLRKSGERLIVSAKEQPLLERHFRDIRRVLIFGNIQVSTQVITEFLRHGIDVSYFSTFGTFRGKLVGATSKNIYSRLAQITRYQDKQFLLSLAKTTVSKKLEAQIKILKKRRFGVKQADPVLQEAVKLISQSLAEISNAQSNALLRGLEGSAARAYFSSFDVLLPSEFPFEKRTRRPALNPMNSALNFSYTLLLNEVNNVLESYGFDVMLGFFHSVRYGRVSLALDAMEIFRPLLVDQWLLQIIRQKKIQYKHFYFNEKKGVYFTDEGRKIFLQLFQQWHTTMHYRDLIEKLVKSLEIAYLEGEVEHYANATEEILLGLL